VVGAALSPRRLADLLRRRKRAPDGERRSG
jgi:hypothetical protein